MKLLNVCVWSLENKQKVIVIVGYFIKSERNKRYES
nr:MAG TPA: hypothetical protein [Caudoviricetes sp.]